MEKFFENTITVEAIKALYKALAKQHHPDLGGDTETMKAINAQYLEALKAMNGKESAGSDGKAHQYYYNQEAEQAVMDKLRDLQSLRMPDSIKIALIGTWIWVRGEARPFKEQLKALNCRWSGEKESWYFHSGPYRRSGKKGGSFGSMAMKYGYKEFANQDNSPQ